MQSNAACILDGQANTFQASHAFAGFLKDASHDGYKLGLEQLRSKYPKGMDFIVFTPVYLTLRQQTLQRLQDAGLKNSDGTEPRVLSYKFSADTLVCPDEECGIAMCFPKLMPAIY